MNKYVMIVSALLAGVAPCAQDASQTNSAPRDAKRPQFQWPQFSGPQNFAIVLDCSSMAERRFDALRRVAAEGVRRLAETDIVSVVVYGDHASVLVPAQPATNREAVVERLAALKPRGEAALFAGLSAAAEELRKNKDGKFTSRMLVLNASSGNVGPHGEGVLWDFADALAKENMRVFFAGMMRRGGYGGEGRPGGFRGRGWPGGFGPRGFGPHRMRIPRRQTDTTAGEMPPKKKGP